MGENIEFDMRALLQNFFNAELLKNKGINKAIKVCNKYGVFGMDAVAFLMELGAAAQEAGKEQENG